MSPQSIGAFQLENLILNRVSFTLLNFGADLSGLFPSYHQSHLDRVSQVVFAGQSLELVKSNASDLSAAYILVCQDGKTSMQECQKLLENGYMNAYYVEGGVASLRS